MYASGETLLDLALYSCCGFSGSWRCTAKCLMQLYSKRPSSPPPVIYSVGYSFSSSQSFTYQGSCIGDTFSISFSQSIAPGGTVEGNGSGTPTGDVTLQARVRVDGETTSDFEFVSDTQVAGLRHERFLF